MFFNVNFNFFFKLIKVHLLVSELYICGIKCFGSTKSLLYQNLKQNTINMQYMLLVSSTAQTASVVSFYIFYQIMPDDCSLDGNM